MINAQLVEKTEFFMKEFALVQLDTHPMTIILNVSHQVRSQQVLEFKLKEPLKTCLLPVHSLVLVLVFLFLVLFLVSSQANKSTT